MKKKLRFYRRNKPRPIQFLKDLYSYWRLRANRELWEFLSAVFAQSKSTGCDYSELLMLYNHIRTVRPSAVLELGSGVSTVIISYAIRSLAATGYRCRFISMEENSEYYTHLLDIFPKPLLKHVEIILSATEDLPLDGGLTSRRYRDKPQLAYDFVFIDGPQVPKSDGYFDGDILDVLDWNSSSIVVFLDQRISTRKVLSKLMPYATIRANREFAVFRIPEAARRYCPSAHFSSKVSHDSSSG